MDKYIIAFLLFTSVVTIVTARAKLVKFDSYYWRDYDEVIPKDALLAGYGKNGQRIYIGQVPDEEKVIPGKIYENDINIYYEFGEHGWSKNESIKILCTEFPDNFEWIPTSIYDVHKLLEKKTIIVGGYQPNFLTFIGRTQVDGDTEVGKVICRETNCLALYINRNGNYEETHDFEILSYNAENENNIAKEA